MINYSLCLYKKAEGTLPQMDHVRTHKNIRLSACLFDFLHYLQCFHLIFESLVLRVEVFDASLGLAQLSFQLGLQLPASLLKLQQLLLSLLTAAEIHESLDNFRQKEVRGRK